MVILVTFLMANSINQTVALQKEEQIVQRQLASEHNKSGDLQNGIANSVAEDTRKMKKDGKIKLLEPTEIKKLR
jgi:hypothetical protein